MSHSISVPQSSSLS